MAQINAQIMMKQLDVFKELKMKQMEVNDEKAKDDTAGAEDVDTEGGDAKMDDLQKRLYNLNPPDKKPGDSSINKDAVTTPITSAGKTSATSYAFFDSRH